MKRFNASLVVVFATLAASACAWAEVPAQQGQQIAMVAPVSASARPAAVVIDSRAPDTERANMGMMILVGLGIVGTLMVKNNRP